MICDSEPYVKKTDLTFHLKKKNRLVDCFQHFPIGYVCFWFNIEYVNASFKSLSFFPKP